MEGRKREKRRHPVRRALLSSALVAAAIFLVLLAAFRGLGDMTAKEALRGGTFWTLFIVLLAAALVGFLLIYRVDARHIVLGENDLEDSDWLTLQEIKKSGKFRVTKFSELGKEKDGTAVTAEKRGGDVEVITTSALHTMIVGTSGCGKTTGFVDQNIAILSSFGSKPSIVVTDPKKELCLKHSETLKKRGYDVRVVDLRSPYASVRWNPLSPLSARCVEIRKLDAEISDRRASDAERAELSVRRQQLWDEVHDLAKDVVYTLCPIKSSEQTSWEEGARDLILALVLAMCEDVAEGYMPPEKLVLFNVFQNVSMYTGEDMSVMKEYLLEKRSPFSKVRGLANTVLVTSDRTLTSYLSDVNAYAQQLSDDGILSMTSSSEMDFFSVDERPTAIFLVVPDEKKTRHSFVTLFVAQMYKELTEKCGINLKNGETDDLVLKRNVYFVLDEFGNIPKIHDMDNIISVARSRGIRFLLILQSLSQLENVYSGKVAGIIRDNCQVKIFIGSDDDETKRTFSKLCGNKKIKSLSVSSSAESQPSSSVGAQNKPLITEGELQRLNGEKQGDAIVCVRGFRPIWGRFTPSYELSGVYFPEVSKGGAEGKQRVFDREELFYDVAKSERMTWAEIEKDRQFADDEAKRHEELTRDKCPAREFPANDGAEPDEYDEAHVGHPEEPGEEFPEWNTGNTKGI